MRVSKKVFIILLIFINSYLVADSVNIVSAEEFYNALKITNFTSRFSISIDSSRQNLCRINGFALSDYDDIYSMFSLSLSDILLLIARNYSDRKIDGKYEIKIESVSGLRNIDSEEDFLDSLTDTPILVKFPKADTFENMSEAISSLIEYSQTLYSGIEINRLFQYRIFDYNDFTYRNGKYIKRFNSDDVKGEVSITFIDKNLAELEFACSFNAASSLLLRSNSIDINFYSKYSKIGETRISK